MSAASFMPGGEAQHERRFVVYRALVAGLQQGAPSGAAYAARSFDARGEGDAAHGLTEAPQVSARGVLQGGLAVTLLHAALVGAWLYTGSAEREPVVTPPIALQMATPPKALPQAPKVAPITPPKPLPQRVQAHAPRPPPAPTPAPVPAPLPPTAAPTAEAAAPVPAPVPAPAPMAAPVPEKTTLPDGNADYLHNPAPDYPPTAQNYGWQGKVLLHVHVRADGAPDAVEVRHSSGHRVLDEAAVAAVHHWSFVPAKRGATPVDGWVDVPINFQLD